MSRLIIIFIAFAILFLFECQKQNSITNPAAKDGSSVSLYFEKPTSLDTLVVFAKAIVSAQNMDTIFVDLTVETNSVTGTIENIPAGPHRKFEVLTYDADTNLTYYGHAFIDVPAGQVITLQIILYPVNNTGTVIIVGTFSPFPHPDSKIVFHADYNGLNDIYMIDPDGNNLINLTNSSFDDIRPLLSPDRSQISFRRIINGIHRPFIMGSDGRNLHELNVLPGYDVGKCDWSPDGQKVTFNAYYDGDDELFTYDLNFEQLNRLTYNSYTDWAPVWSPRGDWIFYMSDEGGFYRMFKIHPDGTGKALINNLQVMEERAPRISPDGNSVVFISRDNSSAWDIFIINVDGSNLVRLTNTPTVNEQECSWSPDGQKIIFVKDDGTMGGGIYTMNADGTDIIQLIDTPYNEDWPHWR